MGRGASSQREPPAIKSLRAPLSCNPPRLTYALPLEDTFHPVPPPPHILHSTEPTSNNFVARDDGGGLTLRVSTNPHVNLSTALGKPFFLR